MSHDFRYVACFVDPKALHEKLTAFPRTPLSHPILTPHVTVSYRPDFVDQSLFGTAVRVRVVGYGSDEENEGLRVELSTRDKRLEKLLRAIELPHITLSISKTGKSVNTRSLNFTAVAPFELLGKYGGYTEGRATVTAPPCKGQ